MAGQLANALVPLRAGEVLTVGLVKAQGGPLLAGATALAGTKALDALCLAGIAALVLGTAVPRQSRLGLLVATAVLLAGLALALFRRAAARWLETGALARKLHVSELLQVAAGIRDWRTLLLVAATSAAVWIAGLGANWLVLLATGITPSLDLAVRVLLAGYIVGLLPAPPARLGVFEAGVVAALSSAGVGLTQSLAAAVMLHVCQLAELGLPLLGSLAWTKWGSGPVAAPVPQVP